LAGKTEYSVAPASFPQGTASRWPLWAEMALVFAVFFIQGAWPVPEVNEPNYLGKAIHFWNPAWAPHDFFLQTADTHWVFYFSFGWLSRWLTPTALAWTGRLITWGLLAWAWQRLSFAVLPRRWLAPVTAALFVALAQHGNLAGEWIIGGLEAKGFAFVFMFLGLEALVRDRWNRAWLLLGIASAFHVLVGGWAVVAAAIALMLAGSARPPLRTMWSGLRGGLLLSLPGLIPALLLNWGTPAAVVREANEIYVYGRLPHHLNPWRFPLDQLVPFVILCCLFLLLGRVAATERPVRRLRAVVVASLAIALLGLLLSLLGFWDRQVAAGLLRFYWFRLADVMVPLGVSLLGMCVIVGLRQRHPRLGRCALAASILLAGLHISDCIVLRLFSRPPHAERYCDLDAWASACRWIAHPGRAAMFPRHPRADRLPDYAAWREACQWASQPENTAPDATFLTPRMSQTFKWYAHRGEAGTWKELPQDARGIVAWWQRMEAFYGTGKALPQEPWYNSLEELGPQRLRQLAAAYHFQYVLTTISDGPLPLPVVYRNRTYIIYRIMKDP